MPKNSRRFATPLTGFCFFAFLLFSCNPEAKQPVSNASNTPDSLNQNTHMKNQSLLNDPLKSYIDSIQPEISRIAPERKQRLQEIAQFVEDQQAEGLPVNLTFICTHNSRRSHMSQIWAAVAAFCYGVDGVVAFSGGTEATAFNPRAVAAMERAGFNIQNPGGENPHYLVSFSEKSPALECFSKTFDDPFNPKQHFAAVMTCSEADKNCPLVPGASGRISIPYQDPKEADGTAEETTRYDERCAQIAAEMLYAFSQVESRKN